MNREFEESEEATQEIVIGKIRVRHVQYLSLAVFRRLLVNYFAILFSQNKIAWPKRYQKPQRRLLLTAI